MKKIILFINRDQKFLKRTQTVLENAGYCIHTAMDLEETLTTLTNHSVGLIICENKLKDISGLDLIYYLKKDPLRDKIPFMFLVSTKQQGDAFRAFELNAEDYLVYPIEDEILIDRVDEVFSSSGLPSAPMDTSSNPVGKTAKENLSNAETLTDANMKIEVSRDNAIWLPGTIIRVGSEHLFIETALFGKPDMFLMARIKMDDEIVVLNGHIKEISYDDFQKPACIEMSIEKGTIWERVYDLLLAQSVSTEGSDVAATDQEEYIELGIDFLVSTEPSENDQKQAGMVKPVEAIKPSYDQRFYYSIIGKQIDDYRAITLINTSGMGGVMQGWDVEQEREVALKIISYHLSEQQVFYESFFKEALIVSRMTHPNLARIYYFGNSNDILYYATEFVDGQTLEDLVLRQGNLTSEKGLEYMISVCEVLEYVHQNNICHRNIKPTNIMVDGAGKIRIIDFGMGLGGNDETSIDLDPAVCGPTYMSPEQTWGKKTDIRSDIYSVGAVFYHAFSGYPPFEMEELDDYISAPFKTLLPPMIEKNPDISVALSKIIEKMMSKAPMNRYQDFKAVIKDIKPLQTQKVHS